MTQGQYQLRVNRLSRIVRGLAYKVISTNRQKFHIAGAAIVMEEVYLKHPEGDYKRTGNLFNSFSTLVEKDTNGASLYLYIKPTDDIRSYSGSGLYGYYPAYVLEGNFFGNLGKDRPFVDRWYNEVGELFYTIVRDNIDRTVTRII